ncbi:hypothetical protein [Parasitella parasitica]|uniref:Uncharacterized protein n=1 Tax=Parasitella parasitica TaxID=35722 RepID=A0A0B7NAK1_9FUNG|nr:hypothetical protein [Parasitella parasitica]
MSSNFFTSFCVPQMTMYRLSLDSEPIVTDVKFNTVPDSYYLCNSVTHVPHLKRSIVIHEAFIKNTTAARFDTYFKALFSKYNINNRENLFVTIMDFSVAHLMKHCFRSKAVTCTEYSQSFVFQDATNLHLLRS